MPGFLVSSTLYLPLGFLRFTYKLVVSRHPKNPGSVTAVQSADWVHIFYTLGVHLHWFLQLYRTADAILVFGGDSCAFWELWRGHSAEGFENTGPLPDWCGIKSNKGTVWETWKLCLGFDKRLEVTTRGIPYSYAEFRLLSQRLQQWNIWTKDGNVHPAKWWTKNWQNTVRSVAVTGSSAAHKMHLGHGALHRTAGLRESHQDRGAAVPGEGPNPPRVQDKKPTKEAKEMVERVRKEKLHPLPIPPICWTNLLEHHGLWWISSSFSKTRELHRQHRSHHPPIKRHRIWSVLWRKLSRNHLPCLRSSARHTRERNRLGFGKSRRTSMQQRLHLAVLAERTKKQAIPGSSSSKVGWDTCKKVSNPGSPNWTTTEPTWPNYKMPKQKLCKKWLWPKRRSHSSTPSPKLPLWKRLRW